MRCNTSCGTLQKVLCTYSRRRSERFALLTRPPSKEHRDDEIICSQNLFSQHLKIVCQLTIVCQRCLLYITTPRDPPFPMRMYIPKRGVSTVFETRASNTVDTPRLGIYIALSWRGKGGSRGGVIYSTYYHTVL